MFSTLALRRKIIPVELVHSKTVFDIKNGDEAHNQTGDGLISIHPDYFLTVTVADCMPLFLYNYKTGVYGIVHSGWKGTGIISNAIELAIKQYGGVADDFLVIIGPHIHDCCYIVNEERAKYFSDNFCEDCVTPCKAGDMCGKVPNQFKIEWNNSGDKLFRLSLFKANLSVLKKCGVLDQNIMVIDECTCCNSLFGSNRRETALEASKTGKDYSVSMVDSSFIPPFTVQAAYIFV